MMARAVLGLQKFSAWMTTRSAVGPISTAVRVGGGSLMMVRKGGQSRMMAPQQAALRDWLGAHFAVQPSKLGPISPPNLASFMRIQAV